VSEDKDRLQQEESEEDVEAHRRHVMANEAPKAEGDDSDDVEAHILSRL
jgi:hypothetical protein